MMRIRWFVLGVAGAATTLSAVGVSAFEPASSAASLPWGASSALSAPGLQPVIGPGHVARTDREARRARNAVKPRRSKSIPTPRLPGPRAIPRPGGMPGPSLPSAPRPRLP